MTFARVKPLGWAFGELLTSAQMTQIDLDHANAVNGLGDTVPGTMVFNGAITSNGSLTCSGGAVFPNTSLCILASGATLYMYAGSTQTVEAGAMIACAGTISGNTSFTGAKTVANGASLGWNSGATCSFASGSTCSHASGSIENYGSGSTTEHFGGSTDTYDASSTLNLNGTTNITGLVVRSGAGYANDRVVNGIDANATYSVTDGDTIMADGITAARTYTLTRTGIGVGARIDICNPTTFPLTVKDESGFTVAVVRENASAGQWKHGLSLMRLGGSADVWFPILGQLV